MADIVRRQITATVHLDTPVITASQVSVRSTRYTCCNSAQKLVPLADLGFFRGGDFGNPSERSIEGVWARGRLKFLRCCELGCGHD